MSDLLAWRVWLERTYSLSAVLVTGAGPRRLTIYTPGRPQTPTPSRTSVVLWLFGRRAEPSHNPKGTSFKTCLFPALHVPSLESLGHMPSYVITAQQLSGTAYRCGFLPSPLLSLHFFLSFLAPFSLFTLTRGSAAFPGTLGDWGLTLPWVKRLQWGQLVQLPKPLQHMGNSALSALLSLHSFIPLPLSFYVSLWLCCSFPQLL